MPLSEHGIVTIQEVLSNPETLFSGNGVGIQVGLTALDSMVGGFQGGELVIIGGRPGIGKTALMISMALNISIQFRVLVLSLEMDAVSLVKRMISATGRTSLHPSQLNCDDEATRRNIANAITTLNERQILLDQTSTLNPGVLRAKVNAAKEDGGVDCVFVDYLQLMTAGSPTALRCEQITTVSRGLKALARDAQIPIIAASQLNRASEGRDSRRPSLCDLRDSGSIEQDADICLLLHRNSYYTTATNADSRDDGEAVLIVAKNRRGPTGDVRLVWISDWTLFDNHPEE